MAVSLKSSFLLPLVLAAAFVLLHNGAAQQEIELDPLPETAYSTIFKYPDSYTGGMQDQDFEQTPEIKPEKQETPVTSAQPKKKNNKGTTPLETNFKGAWELFLENTGVSVMHSILLPKVNRMVCYDATIWKVSRIMLKPGTPCRKVNPQTNELDCWAHSVEIDVETGDLKPLLLDTDTWCSAGALDSNGTLVGTGGDKYGTRTVRYLSACEDCKWREYPMSLAQGRWYGTQVALDNGDFAVFGGRGSFSYEFIPQEGKTNPMPINFPFLHDTTDKDVENNLYPFVHLSTDGNLFVFANSRSVLLDVRKNKIIREFPVLEGGSRNYPASGMSALLPIRLYVQNPKTIKAEVLICGGAPQNAFDLAQNKRVYLPALRDCARIDITNPKATWKKEYMPRPRVMGDMMILPTGDILMLNGAMKGSSAWNDAEEPNFIPLLYKYNAAVNTRFVELTPSDIPRMYHSSTNLLPDGKVFVAGSNTNDGYLVNAPYPTEMRAEKFSPPYLDPELDNYRPVIHVEASNEKLAYGKQFKVVFDISETTVLTKDDIEVSIYSPAFTTHGVSMNQRLVFLGKANLIQKGWQLWEASLMAPPSGKIAPPGYYMLFVVHRGVPSKSMWVQIL